MARPPADREDVFSDVETLVAAVTDLATEGDRNVS